MVKVVCPSCLGAKAGYGVACSDRGCRWGKIACDFCKSEGQVSSAPSEHWPKGRAMRDAMIKRGLTLFQEAAILGIDPIVLNDIERGRRLFNELNQPSM